MTNYDIPLTPVLMDNKPEKRVWGPWPTVGLGVAVLVGFFIAQTLAALITMIVIAFSGNGSVGNLGPDELLKTLMDIYNANMGLLQSIAIGISGIVGVALIFVFIRSRKRAGIIEYLGLYEISGKQVLLSLGIILAYVGLTTLLQTLIGIDAGDAVNLDLYSTSIWPPLFWVAVVIFAPLFEEALFRGFVFEGFLQSRLGPVGAIIITSVVWACLHLQYNFFGIVYILLLGIIMGVVRWKTRRLWSTVIMHSAMNLMAVVSISLTANT